MDGPEISKVRPEISKDGPEIRKDGPEISKDGPKIRKDGPILAILYFLPKFYGIKLIKRNYP